MKSKANEDLFMMDTTPAAAGSVAGAAARQSRKERAAAKELQVLKALEPRSAVKPVAARPGAKRVLQVSPLALAVAC